MKRCDRLWYGKHHIPSNNIPSHHITLINVIHQITSHHITLINVIHQITSHHNHISPLRRASIIFLAISGFLLSKSFIFAAAAKSPLVSARRLNTSYATYHSMYGRDGRGVRDEDRDKHRYDHK